MEPVTSTLEPAPRLYRATSTASARTERKRAHRSYQSGMHTGNHEDLCCPVDLRLTLSRAYRLS